jgi:hypothetical protein
MMQLASESATYNEGAGNIGAAAPTGLDYAFPYAQAVLTNTTWNSDDSPASYLTPGANPPCTSETFSGNFVDYFMYQPSAVPSPVPTGARVGSRLWTTLAKMTWGFQGTVTSSHGAAYSLAKNPTQEPTPVYSLSSELPTWDSLFESLSQFC